MIVYNETYIVEEGIHQKWLHWMKTQQLPAIMGTGYFESFHILTVLDSPNEGVTYCIQYHTDTPAQLNDYLAIYAGEFEAAHQQQFENQFVVFNTVMQLID